MKYEIITHPQFFIEDMVIAQVNYISGAVGFYTFLYETAKANPNVVAITKLKKIKSKSTQSL